MGTKLAKELTQLDKVSIGGTAAPNKFKFDTISGEISFSSGDVLDGLTIDGIQKGGGGGNTNKITLQAGEYFNSFELNANMGYMQGVVIACKFTTNLGNVVEFNAGELSASNNPPTSAKVTNCKVHAISVIYGDFINQMTVHYISDYDSSE